MKKVKKMLFSKKADEFAQSIIFLLPFVFLFTHYFINLFFIFQFKYLNYDEFVMYSISQQDLPQLLHTLESEPHPPGFYLLLKATSLLIPSISDIKILFSTISLLGFVGVVLYSHRYLSKSFTFFPLLFALFTMSFGVGQILTTMKQDMFTFPLLLFLFLYILKNGTISKRISRFNLLVPSLLVLCILSLGYVAFFNAILLFTIFTLYLVKRDKKISHLFPLAIITIITLVYFAVFGFQQTATNTGRFGWINEQNNDFLSNFTVFVSGALPEHLITDLLLLFFAVGVVNFLNKWSEFPETEKTGFLILLLFLLPIFFLQYYFQLFSEFRYILLSIFFVYILISKGLSFLPKPALLFFLIVIFAVTATIMYQGKLLVYAATSSFLQIFDQEIQTEKTGIMSGTTLSSLYLKLQHFPANDNLIAINPTNNTSQFLNKTTFEKEDLILDGKREIFLSDPQFFNKLEEQNIHRVIYYNLTEKHSHDPTIIIGYLLTKCEFEKSLYSPYGQTFIIFNQCKS